MVGDEIEVPLLSVSADTVRSASARRGHSGLRTEIYLKIVAEREDAHAAGEAKGARGTLSTPAVEHPPGGAARCDGLSIAVPER